MKATELRIGNYIKDGNDIEKLTKKHMICLCSGTCEFDAIPLTEEWLLKFGFEKDDIEALSKDINSNCFMYFENGAVELLEAESQVALGKKIKYVHQLQNIYFALTNEELIYTK